MPDLVQLETEIVAGVRAEVDAAELPALFGRVMGEVMAGVPRELIAGPVVAVYHRDEGDHFDVTIGMAVAAPPDVAGLTVVELPAGAALRAIHRGPYPQLGEAYAELRTELEARGLVLTYAWERYVVGPGDTAEPADFVTEVVTPLP